MAYPTSILSLAHAIGSQFLSVFFGGSVAHSTGVNQIIDDLIAVETKLGTGTSAATAGTVLRGTGAGTTAFGAIVNADVDAAAAIAVTKLAAGTANTVLMGGASNAFSASPTVSGTLTATTALKSGGLVLASGAATYGRSTPSEAVTVAASATLSLGAGLQFVKIINHSTGHMAEFACKGAANAVVAHSASTTGFTVNADSGSDIAVYHDGSVYRIKNRTGGNQILTVIKDGN